MNMIEIPLTQGQIAIVDDEDSDLVGAKWQAAFRRAYSDGGRFVAQRSPYVNGKRSTELMHRFIFSRMIGRPLLRSEQVDHINHQPLDNRRENLRLATNSQNCMNKGKPSTNTSGFKGVSWHKAHNKWFAQIKVNGKNNHLGYHDSAEAAFEAYCKAAPVEHGEFANTGEVV